MSNLRTFNTSAVFNLCYKQSVFLSKQQQVNYSVDKFTLSSGVFSSYVFVRAISCC